MTNMGALLDLSVGIVGILFTLSLIAAWVLFHVLKSTAAITKKEYQVGGAAAGFLLIYGALYSSYTGLANIENVRTRLTGCQASLAAEEKSVVVKGKVEPSVSYAHAFVGTNFGEVDTEGNFRVKVRVKDFAGLPQLWVVNGQHKVFRNLDETQIDHLTFDLSKEAAQ